MGKEEYLDIMFKTVPPVSERHLRFHWIYPDPIAEYDTREHPSKRDLRPVIAEWSCHKDDEEGTWRMFGETTPLTVKDLCRRGWIYLCSIENLRNPDIL